MAQAVSTPRTATRTVARRKSLGQGITEYIAIVHLVGLAYTRAWTMARISGYLPQGHPLKARFARTSAQMYAHGMDQIFRSDYGGDHWLATFARYAEEVMKANKIKH